MPFWIILKIRLFGKITFFLFDFVILFRILINAFVYYSEEICLLSATGTAALVKVFDSANVKSFEDSSAPKSVSESEVFFFCSLTLYLIYLFGPLMISI